MEKENQSCRGRVEAAVSGPGGRLLPGGEGLVGWERAGPSKVTVPASDKLLTDYTGISCQEINLLNVFV